MVDTARDEEKDLSEQYGDGEQPAGTVERAKLTPEVARSLYDKIANDEVPAVPGVDLSQAFRDALDLGDPDRPSDFFTRMYFSSQREADWWAVNMARSARFLRRNPLWAKEHWVTMAPDARLHYLKGIANRCVDYRAMRVAVMVQTTVLAPSLFDMAKSKVGRLFTRKRKSDKTSEDGR